MTKILVISDIHANQTALEAVLSHAGSVDAVWCLGDLVGYGPDPNQCIERIRSLPNLACLLGNHDAAALGHIDLEAFNHEARLSANWMISQLSEESLDFMKSLPEKLVIGQVTLAHGSPRNPVWEYLLDTYTTSLNLDAFETDFCFVGHTHIPITYLAINGAHSVEWRTAHYGEKFKLDRRAILNPGSVGQPRDNDPRAAYAIFDPDEKTWEAQRVEYDVASVQRRIFEAGLPQRHAVRLATGW